MASWQMRGVAAFTRLAYRRRFLSEEAGHRTLHRAKGPSTPPSGLAKRFRLSVDRAHGFDVHRLQAGAKPSETVVVYLHGGAYTSEIVPQHWSLIADIATRTGCDVYVPIYGLAPAHHGLQALEFVTAVVTSLTASGRRCYLAGDSAGGGLALLTAQATGPTGIAGLTVLAPWLDLSMANPGVDAIQPFDPWLSRPGLRPIAAAWAGGLELTDPRVSPLYGDLTDLPPLQILVGTRDITLADCRTLRDRLPLTSALTYHEEPGAIHVYPLLPVPESRAGRDAIVSHIRSCVDY
ncbi:alpha/beta hydrolase fold domain-containing protein [Actinoplanes sp. NPDC051851]|uniref:alpha/beta hydrolase fold domain-containing protein n=1 Tax=Actinoplanes sp. NPDC051851 TaxID=3154753 RepID=UPI0034129B7B